MLTATGKVAGHFQTCILLNKNKDHWTKNAAFLEATTEWDQNGFNFLPSWLNSLTQVSYLNKLDINFKYQVKSHLSHKVIALSPVKLTL